MSHLAQQGEDLAVEREADLLELAHPSLRSGGLLLRGDRVVRHHRGGAGVHRGLEGRQVIVLERAGGGVDVEAALRVVGVGAVLPRPAAGEVLDRQGHAVGVEALAALEAAHQRRDRGADELGILAEGALASEPARIGEHIGHVHVALAQAGGAPLRAGVLGEGLDQLERAGRGQPQGARPLREGQVLGGAAHLEGAGLVLRVRGDDHGNAEAGVLGHLVHGVDPGRDPGAGGLLAHDEVADAELRDHLRGALEGDPGTGVRIQLDRQVLLVEHAVVAGHLLVALGDAHRP